MRAKRQKHQKHCMTFYRKNFGYSPPYQVLIDGTFCKAALKFKVNIMDQLPKYLDAEVHYFTTKCVLGECEALGKLLYGPLKVLRQYHVMPCRHNPGFPPQKCFRALVKEHKRRFIIATQDSEISDMVRSKAGLPLMYIAYKAITVEAPTEHSKSVAEKKVKEQLAPSDYSMHVIQQLKRSTFGEEEVAVRKKKKKKLLKEPNPLSVKKKKKRTEEEKKKLREKKRKLKKNKKRHAVDVPMETVLATVAASS